VVRYLWKKKVLLLSNPGTAVGWILFLFALFLPFEKSNIEIAFLGTFVIVLPLLILFLARAIDGITGGNISVANAYLADISSDRTRSKNFGKIAISSNLGFIVGPALAGILGGTIYGAILPVLAALLLSLVTILVIAFLLKESKPISNEIIVSKETTIRRVFSQECRDCSLAADTTKSRSRDVFKVYQSKFINCRPKIFRLKVISAVLDRERIIKVWNARRELITSCKYTSKPSFSAHHMIICFCCTF
jgi:MFS transporter, DHA1 family, tetracycline resistance protein